MRFPNLVWAIAQRRQAHYETAAEVGMSESRFSRCLSGRAEFSPEERQRLTDVLDYPDAWLFREVTPPQPLQKLENYVELMTE